MLRLFERVHADGQTLVVVSHERRTAATADRMVSMRDGVLVDDVALPPGTDSTVEILAAGGRE